MIGVVTELVLVRFHLIPEWLNMGFGVISERGMLSAEARYLETLMVDVIGFGAGASSRS